MVLVCEGEKYLISLKDLSIRKFILNKFPAEQNGKRCDYVRSEGKRERHPKNRKGSAYSKSPALAILELGEIEVSETSVCLFL